MGLSHSAQNHHCTHLENAGYERNKKSQNISNFLVGNLKQGGGTQEKEYLGKGNTIRSGLVGTTQSLAGGDPSPCLCINQGLICHRLQ